MKRFLLIPSFAFLAVSTLTSCQKEEKTALELTQELTAELQKVTDYRTAEAAAPRVEVLNKRMQNASVRPFALNETALTRSAEGTEGSEGAAYADALAQLAAEIGRVQASTPVAVADGDIDRDKLVLAVGAANGSSVSASVAERKKAGLVYIQDTTGTHETPGNFAEYYGSDKLREALGYKADPSAVGMWKMDSEEDVPPVPAAVDVPEEEEAPADEETATDDSETPAADDTEEPAADDTEEPSIDEEPAVDDTEEPSIDEEPAADDTEEPSIDEEPAADDSSDMGDISLDGDSEDSGSDDLDVGDAGDEGDAGDISLDLDL